MFLQIERIKSLWNDGKPKEELWWEVIVILNKAQGTYGTGNKDIFGPPEVLGLKELSKPLFLKCCAQGQ